MDFIEACCVCCGPAPRPVLICACDPALTFTSSVYCGTKCRDYDSRTHEKRCEGNFQRAVYRAGDLVRDIFYAFREATFSLKIKKVETRNEELHVYLGDYDIGLHPPYDFSRSGGPLFRFPVQLVSSLEERARLLTMSSCMEAVAFMGELIKHLLEGVATTIEEADFSSRIRGSRSTARYFSDGIRDERGQSHSVVTVEAKDGGSYVFDIAGAQNRQFEAVVPLETFINREKAVMTKLLPHGRTLAIYASMAKGKWPTEEGIDIRGHQVKLLVFQQMQLTIPLWEKENMSLRFLLHNTTQMQFEYYKTSLVAKLRTELKAFVAKWEKDGKTLERTVSRWVGVPFVGLDKCTVIPEGKGSQAYQKFMEHKVAYPAPPPRLVEFRTEEVRVEHIAANSKKPKSKTMAQKKLGAKPALSWNEQMDQLVDYFKLNG